MSAIEEPDTNSEPGGPARPSDELEDWLSDLRTDVSADPSGWINKDAAGEPPADKTDKRRPAAPDRRGADAATPSGGGRHRAPD
jgi:hypothetical protein